MKRNVNKIARNAKEAISFICECLAPHYRFMLYISLFIVGTVFIGASFETTENWVNVFCGVGTGIFTSTLVTIIINNENEQREKKRLQRDKKFLLNNMLEYSLDVYEDVIGRINEYITLSDIKIPCMYALYKCFTPFNEFAHYLETLDLNSLSADEIKKLSKVFNFNNYRIDHLISELKHLPRQEYFLRGVLSQKEYSMLVNQHVNDQYLAYAERIDEFWDDEIIDINRCIQFLRMTLYITSKTISVFDFAAKKAQYKEEFIKERIAQLYFDEVYSQSDEYIESQIRKGQEEMEYYAEHPEIVEELNRRYEEWENATEEDRDLDNLSNCIIGFSEYSMADILKKLDKDSKKVQAFFNQESIKEALRKDRKHRKIIATQYGKHYLRDISTKGHLLRCLLKRRQR